MSDSCRAGAKLSFGDFGQKKYNGWNVFVGEHDTNDTDRLWLHGKNGFNLTSVNGDDWYSIMKYNLKENDVLHINPDLALDSKIKFRADVWKIHDPVIIPAVYPRILNVCGMQYVYTPYNDMPLTNNQTSGATVKEANDMNFLNTFLSNKKSRADFKFGFDPYKLQTVFPELVEINDSTDEAYIDYIGFIPLLVEAIKEQSFIISAQSLKIKALEENTDILLNDVQPAKNININGAEVQKAETATNYGIGKDNAFLYQNTPNPFNQATEIKYFLPEGTENAYLYVFDMQGAMQLEFFLNETGLESVVIDASSLKAGMYMYTLVIDGIQIETKRMILTK